MSNILKLFLIIFVFSNLTVNTQNIDPSIQPKIDSLNAWIKHQLETTGTIDQVKLDSMNQNIRNAQNKLSSEIQINSENISLNVNKQTEKKLTRDMMPGSVFTVPEGVVWQIKKVSCKTDMGGYSVLVTSVKFKDEYKSGEKISMPAFTSEASLLSEDTSSVIYTFEIIEIPKPK